MPTKKIFRLAILISALPINSVIGAEMHFDWKNNLLSITDIEISGARYDVSFIHATCNSWPCGLGPDSGAGTPDNLSFAIDSVYAVQQSINGLPTPDPSYNKIYGFSEYGDPYSITRPYPNFADGRYYVNSMFGEIGFGARVYSTATSYSIWTPSAVPIPASAALFSSGLIGLMLSKSRQRRRFFRKHDHDTCK